MDEAAVVLDESDQAEVRRHQAEAKEHKQEENKFIEQYRSQSASVRISSAKTAAQKKAATKVAWKGRRSMPPLGQLSQAEGKKLMPPSPPQSWLWRANRAGAWCSRVSDLSACQRSDSAHGGEEAALHLVIQDAWRQWLALQGWCEADCPVQGMFDVVDPRASSSTVRAS